MLLHEEKTTVLSALPTAEMAGYTVIDQSIPLMKASLAVYYDPDSLYRLRKTLQSVLSLPFDEYLTGHAPKPLKKVQIEAHLRHLETLGSVALTPSALAGERVWHSQWKQGTLRSEFILGDAARRGLEQAAQPGETP